MEEMKLLENGKPNLKQIVLCEDDWIPGTEKKSLEDYEEVLAYHEGNFFSAYLKPARDSRTHERIRIWRDSRKSRCRSIYPKEDPVKYYILFEKLRSSLPE